MDRTDIVEDPFRHCRRSSTSQANPSARRSTSFPVRPLPSSPVLRVPFAWSSGKPSTSGLAEVGEAKMAEEKPSAVSFEILFRVWTSGRGCGWAESGRAEQSGEAGRRVACVPLSGRWRNAGLGGPPRVGRGDAVGFRGTARPGSRLRSFQLLGLC